MSQSKANVAALYARVLDFDSINIQSFDNVSIGGYKYFYGICHIKVATAKNDSLIIGIVYNLVTDKIKALDRFGLQKDSVYIFYVSEFRPCYSDFPSFCNCNYKKEKKYGQVMPNTGSIIGKPYSKINRVILFTPLDRSLWKQLVEW
jgi:hypothetical protein